VLDDKKHEVWLDVSDPVVEALELDCRRMTEERVCLTTERTEIDADIQDVRRTELIGSIVELRWLHNELGFPALALNGSQAHFPQDMLPDKANEETPGAHQTYERLLAKFIFINKDVVAEENQEPELEGLDDVQPEIGLINWVNEIAGLVSVQAIFHARVADQQWHARRDVHQLRIQEIFNQIEPQWVRMGVDQEFMDVFFAINMGSSESAIAAVRPNPCNTGRGADR
jgi:protein regulator of cytokinesis 1